MRGRCRQITIRIRNSTAQSWSVFTAGCGFAPAELIRSPIPPPLRPQLGDLADKFRPWRMEELRLAKRIVYQVKANWKIVVQNYSECLHCPLLHPVLHGLSHYLSGENEPPQPSYMGGRM